MSTKTRLWFTRWLMAGRHHLKDTGFIVEIAGRID